MDDSKKKILVVEDEKSISDIIRYNLEKEGFRFMRHTMARRL